MSNAYKITLIGCGRMGGAMLKGWLNSDISATYNIVEPYGQPEFTKVCEALKHIITKKCLILSVAAGQTIGNFENYFGEDQPIVRVMPNTPAAIGEGMSVAVGNKNVSDTQKDIVTQMLNCSGKSAWVDDENLMNAVTAVSGSGPAYIFHLIEALAKAGEHVGLGGKTAMILARQTVVGSAALAAAEEDTPASTLRENVTSPNGTTAAALDVLMDGRFQEILNEALNAAKTRGEELAG